ncbi:MAG: extracellular solute-binding protein [Microgenomates group bacterium]
MPKFPDPTKDYGGTPVTGAIDLSPQGKVEGTAETKNEAPPLYVAPTPAPAPSPLVEQGSAGGMTPDIKVSGSPFRNIFPILIGIGAIVVLIILAMVVIPMFTKKTTVTTLNYWGLWEPSSVMQGVIADYESSNPNIKIKYTMTSPKNYRTRFLAAGTQADAPDIVRIHNTWLPMLKKDLAPAPDTVLKVSDLSTYYPIVQQNFVSGGKVYGLPLEIDGLALLYNVDMLKEAGAEPPTDWNALRKLAFDLTKTNPETKIIERAGVALGTTNNVDNWSDILGLLILQNSGDPGRPSDTAVQDALTFYTIISTQDKSWDATQPNSAYAFATGTVAMILAPSWQVSEIKAINPELNFKVAPAPVLPSANYTWATYWGEAVPLTSKNQTQAWKFIKYLSTPEVLQKMYAGASQIRALGEPYPLTTLSSTLANDPLAAPFVAQGPSYKSWYLSGRTFDEGINDGFIKYYEDAINAINSGSSVGAVLKPLDEGVKQLLLKYPEAK